MLGDKEQPTVPNAGTVDDQRDSAQPRPPDSGPDHTAAQHPSSSAGEDAEALYAQGMSHYRRREWTEAKECFARLKAAAPDRRGIDALLNEVDIFIQLRKMQPEDQQADVANVAGLQSESATRPRHFQAIPRKRRRSPWPVVVLALALLFALALALYATGAFDAFVGSQRQARVQALVNQGRAAINVGEYDRAVSAFGEALALAPNNEDVKTWYAKARRYQQLAGSYAQAEAAITAEDWNSALAKLAEVAALDPTYHDVTEKIGFVKKQQSMALLLSEAKGYLQEDKWDDAIRILDQLREAAFSDDEVAQDLFYAYFQKGVDLLLQSGDDLDLATRAIQSFDSALVVSPDNDTALEEKRLADLYRQGRLSMDQMDWPRAVVPLKQIYDARPDYLAGRMTSLLCTAYLRLGAVYESAGNLAEALQQYRYVLGIQSCDHVEAAVKERDVSATLYPPTPTPTQTPTATRTPRPTSTPTATPTETPLPSPTSRPPTPVPTLPPR